MLHYLYMKICKECKQEKETTEFYGVQGECKVCTRKKVKEYRSNNSEKVKTYDRERNKNSVNRIFLRRYYMIKCRCTKVHITNGIKKSVYGKDFLTKSEWLEWCYKEENYKKFIRIYNNWVKHNFDRKLAPSIDRIDNKVGYVVSNLQWLSLTKNAKKYNK